MGICMSLGVSVTSNNNYRYLSVFNSFYFGSLLLALGFAWSSACQIKVEISVHEFAAFRNLQCVLQTATGWVRRTNMHSHVYLTQSETGEPC